MTLDPRTASLYRLPTRYLQLSARIRLKLFLFTVCSLRIPTAVVFSILFLSTFSGKISGNYISDNESCMRYIRDLGKNDLTMDNCEGHEMRFIVRERDVQSTVMHNQ